MLKTVANYIGLSSNSSTPHSPEQPAATGTSESIRKPAAATSHSRRHEMAKEVSNTSRSQHASRGISSRRRDDRDGDRRLAKSSITSKSRPEAEKSNNRLSISNFWPKKDTEEDSREEEVLRDRLNELEQEYKSLTAKYDEATSYHRSLEETVENSKNDLKKAMGTIRAREEEVKKAEKRAEDAGLELERRQNENRLQLEQHQSVKRSLQASLDRKEEEQRSLRSEYDNLARHYQDLEAKARAVDEDRKRLKMQLDHQTAEIDDLRKKYDACRQMLELRTKELQGAQEYLHSTRTYSGADLIRLIESLNGEIMQAAASITDTLDIATIASNRRSMGSHKVARRELSPFLADETVTLLHSIEIDDLDILIQSAFQAAMAYQCTIWINAWSPEDGQDNFLRDLFQKQALSPVAGRWRAITKTHTKYAVIDQIELKMHDRIFDAIVAVIYVAGLSPKDKEHEGEITKIIRERIVIIANQALQIDRIIGLEMTSEELEVYVAPVGEPLDQDLMEDVFERNSSDAEANCRALCTTDMGLRCRQAQGAEEVWQVMLRAKVVGDTAFA
ncbi:hypothetical protein Moror_2704 [Moniliophthora roreri MCA 2997]|uniref:Uncharacterized protein n=2 Tax=Moniliophthora roreri TaxID=221103 RepID=V2XF11_MONRO|nr:hypothetical protein Moror_2704 [Moniliophthora roreri MCA 2997]KAI3611662.1 hypothetical protein WG66_007714 [Moniliophthora roreri]